MNKTYILRVMRLLVLFLLVGFLQVSANAYSQTVTLKAKEMSLREVFDVIRDQTGYTVVGFAESLHNSRRVTVDVSNESLINFLEQVLAGQQVDFEIERKTILIKERTTDRIAAFSEVHGRVLDSLGQPLEGASVRVLDHAGRFTTQQTSTGRDGRFLLRDVPQGARILISYIGYTSIELDAAGDVGTITLLMQSGVVDHVTIVVNTGYTSLPKERSAGSFSTVSGEQMTLKSGSMNVIDRLEGLVPGLAVNYGEGNDKILLRGVTSVNLDRSPLIVVDGVPLADFNDLERLVSPGDVKDVTLLKDATAASIWGAQAANGVVVVTTHGGAYHAGKVKIGYQGFASVKGLPDQGYSKRMSTSDFIDTYRFLSQDSAYRAAFPLSDLLGRDYPRVYPHERPLYDLEAGTITREQADRQWDSLATLNNRAQIERYFYRPAMLTNHNLTASGGSQYHRYHASFGYTHQHQYDRADRDRYHFSLKEEWKLGGRLLLDVTGNMAYETYHNPLLTVPTALDSYLPYALFADASGRGLDQTYLYMTEDYREAAMANSGLDLAYIPLEERRHTQDRNQVFSGRLNAGLAFDIGHGLSLQGRGQFQKTMDDGYVYKDDQAYSVQLEKIQFTQLPDKPEDSPVHFLPVTGGNYETHLRQVQSWTFRSQLNYDNDASATHRLNALVGFESRGNHYDIRQTQTKGYDFQTQRYAPFDQKYLEQTGIANPALPTLNRTGGANRLFYRPLTRVESELRFVSFYGNVAYSYDQRFNLNGSLRYDQSNLFGKSTSSQEKPIWSVGGSWHLHRETFFDTGILSQLTFRTTYGIGGNSPKPGLGGVNDLLYAVSNSYTQDLGDSYVVISPANHQLVWEKTRIWNVGIDFATANQRIRGSLEYYDKQTTDLLGERPLDPTTGWTSAFGNLGDLYNRGFELSLHATVISTTEFGWRTQFNLAFNRNRIIRLKHYNAASPLQKATSSFLEGYSAYSLFALAYAGLDDQGNPRVHIKDGNLASLTNELSLDDVYFQGSTQPLYYGGMTNALTYKNWSLSALLVYNFGHVMRQELNTTFSGRLSGNISQVFDHRWKQPGDERHTDIPKYIPNETQSDSERATQFYRYADVHTVQASYIKLRDLTLSYDFAKHLPGTVRLDQLKLYAQVNNVLVWTHNDSGIDPEYYSLSGGYRTLKMPAFYTFGLHIIF